MLAENSLKSDLILAPLLKCYHICIKLGKFWRFLDKNAIKLKNDPPRDLENLAPPPLNFDSYATFSSSTIVVCVCHVSFIQLINKTNNSPIPFFHY